MNMNKSIRQDFLEVKEIGERIGYGNLMSLASSLWRKNLKDDGLPADGAFIPVIRKLPEAEKIYDDYLKNL